MCLPSTITDVPTLLTSFLMHVTLQLHESQRDQSTIDRACMAYLPLVLDTNANMLYLQSMEGKVEWRSPAQSRTIQMQNNSADPIPIVAPKTWDQLCAVFINKFSHANAVGDWGRQWANIPQKSDETLEVYALRFQHLLGRFTTAVDRLSPDSSNRKYIDQITIAIFEGGLQPHLQLKQFSEDFASTLPDAFTRAKRHEANNLTGKGHAHALAPVSSIPSTVTTAVSAVSASHAAQPKFPSAKIVALQATNKRLEREVRTLNRQFSRLLKNIHAS
ncbi:unnamed protein product [Choristocarpus tenellus]